LTIHKRIEEEDLCDMEYINDATRFSIFDIRDALNEADDMSLTYKQKERVFYTLNAFARHYEDLDNEEVDDE
tara:strand:- start:169 stop:384 length:216 start_codon:yes stop_codon:yes gene_type:complete